MIEFRIKEKTRSLNESFRGDWRPRAAAAKRQRTKAMQACPTWPGGPLLVVRITRVSPGTLDGDAVPAALKHIRDGVASRLKIDDASPLVEWQYHQAKGEAEVVVQIWSAWATRPPLPVGQKAPPGKALKDKGEKRAPRQTCGKNGCRNLRPCASHDAPSAVMDYVKQPRAPRITYAKTTGPVENYRPPPERHADDAAFNAEVMRRVGLKAAQEAEATFAPGPDAPDMTDALGPGPHPEHYNCPCAPCIGRWNP